MSFTERSTVLTERTKDYFKESKYRTGILFAGATLIVSGALGIQSGDYDNLSLGLPMLAGEGITTLVVGNIAKRVEEKRNEAHQTLLEANQPSIIEKAKTEIDKTI